MNWSLLKDRVGRVPLLGPAARALFAAVRVARRELNWARWRLTGARRPALEPVPGPLRIVLAGYHPSLVRERKLARAARLRGLHVSLFAPPSVSRATESRDFDEVHRVGDAAAALRLLQRRPADVVHVLAPATGSLLALRLLRHSPAPTVFDPYDCTEGFILPEHLPPPDRIAMERECFRLADHVCSRSLEPLHLRRVHGYEMPRATFFPDYCWELPRRRSQREVGADGELHLVYAGGIRPEDRYPAEQWGYSQYLEIGRILAEQRVHLHLYPSPIPGRDELFEEHFALYLREQERSPYFHLYRPLPSEELARRLPEHDAAIQVAGAGLSDALGWNTEAKMHHSSANKLFDYVEAGLPVILHAGRLQRALVRHYGELVELDDLRGCRRALTELLAKPPREAAAAATLEHHSPRLVEMYRSLAARTRSD